MDKGSAPPMEDARQQGAGYTDMPPSYEESSRDVGAGGFAAPPPGPSAMYPPIPEDQNKGAYMPPQGQQPQGPAVVTQVREFSEQTHCQFIYCRGAAHHTYLILKTLSKIDLSICIRRNCNTITNSVYNLC